MNTYVQFYSLSNGYVEGTIPPQFKEELKKPIEAIGSDGVYILDGRNNLTTMICDAKDRMSKLSIKNFVGFKIIKAQSFLDKGREIYSSF